MTQYRYEALDAEGRPVAGSLDAAHVDEALAKLAAVGLVGRPDRLWPVLADTFPASTSSSRPLSEAEAVDLSSAVAELAQNQLPMASGLRAMAEETPGDRLPRLLRRVADRLDAGAGLDEAVAAEGGAFPPHLRGLMAAGARTGRLAEVLEHFVALQRTRADLRRRLWSVLAYPAILLIIMLLIYVLFNMYIILQFARIYEDFGTELPALTQAVIWSSRSGSWGLVGGLLAIALFVVLAGVTPWGPHRALYALPVIGPLWRSRRLVEFSRWMGLLLELGVPMPQALRWTAQAASDSTFRRACRLASEQVESGRSLAEAMGLFSAFPPTLRPMVAWGETTSNLPEAFRAAAELYEGRMGIQSTLLEVLALPIVLLLIIGFVGTVIIALFLPLISLIHNLT
ncbi:MAG: type II secretion system F family protein [Thermoguttaceae bacterium]|nr:type II secretion system F family protein [Thermoguttaceae bacterium]